MSNIHKIWGERRRIHLDDKNEIDLLYLKRDTFCSTHNHKAKHNKFIVVSGKVRIESEYGNVSLSPNDSWTVEAPLKHRFYAEEDSIMIEMAYVTKGNIDPDDINRESQGGMIVNGQEMTLDQMREKGLLDL
jgi:mannose-6-phosphate isomerase-like protein (cupin superfamily)